MRTIYGVRDIYGELIAEHVKVRLPDGSKRMYWRQPNMSPEDGLGGLSTAELPLYGSEAIGKFSTGQTVVVTEGEGAAAALRSLGVDALGTVTGASSTPGEDALSPLLPFDVVLWPDHDDPGRAHMERVGRAIVRLGGVVRWLTWGTEQGDDAADFVERGGTPACLAQMVRNARPWVPEPEAPKTPPQTRYGRCSGDPDRTQRARSHLAQVAIDKLGRPARQDRRSLWWCCPFHHEKTPSFKVDLSEPYYRCHGCGARGDVFTFLREMEGLAFKDAIRELAPPRLLGAAIPW